MDDIERIDNIKRYHAKRAHTSLVQFHSDIYELAKAYKDNPGAISTLNGLDFEALFAEAKKLAGIDYGNTIGYGAKKASAGQSDSDM